MLEHYRFQCPGSIGNPPSGPAGSRRVPLGPVGSRWFPMGPVGSRWGSSSLISGSYGSNNQPLLQGNNPPRVNPPGLLCHLSWRFACWILLLLFNVAAVTFVLSPTICWTPSLLVFLQQRIAMPCPPLPFPISLESRHNRNNTSHFFNRNSYFFQLYMM